MDESDEDDDVEGESGSEDSGASSLGKETTTKDEDYESDSDYSEYGSEEIDQEEERSEVSYEDEVKESDQLKLLFKMKRTSSSKIKKSNTENSSNISQITSKNKIFNKERQVDENETTKQIDDEYKSDSSDEEVCCNNIYSLSYVHGQITHYVLFLILT